MGYISQTKTYTIDLNLPEEERWQKVIKDDKIAVKKLINEAKKDISHVPRFLRWIFRKGYQLVGGYYTDEMDSWASSLDVARGDVAMLQCSYELAHFSEYVGERIPIRPFGCTTGVKWLKGVGMVHLRNMDWPLRNIGKTTRLFKFTNGNRHFIAVGVSGFVGVLSGMLPGAYSITMNYSPVTRRPRLMNWGPSFLLRDVLEECDTYEDAVYYLKNEILSTGVLYTICGTKKGQACIIERTGDKASVIKMKDKSLVSANHYTSNKFKNYNFDEGLLEWSLTRYDTMKDLLEYQRKYHSKENIFKCLNVEPVFNDDSYQQMMFIPARDELKVRRWV